MPRGMLLPEMFLHLLMHSNIYFKILTGTVQLCIHIRNYFIMILFTLGVCLA